MMKPYYEDTHVKIFNGDCREILPILEPVDLVLTDPPYGIGISNKNLGEGRSTGIKSTKMIYGNWDNKRVENWLILLLVEKSKNQIIWGGNYYSDILKPSQCWLCWDKRGEQIPERSYADCELAYTSFDKAVRRKILPWDGFIVPSNDKRNGHPTQKPLDIIKWCISIAGEADTILDPFMGSGTTLRAAKDLNRKAIGIEIEEKYCEIAAQRMCQEVLEL